MRKAKQTLRTDELVRLVLPAHADFGDGHAHVARAAFPLKTVCGTPIKYWWFWHPGGARSAGRLRSGWELREKMYPHSSFRPHFVGTHLGAPLDMSVDICSNCYALVMWGFRPRWRGETPEDEAAYYSDDWRYATEAEALTRHGFDPAEDLCPKCGNQLGSLACEDATASMTDGHTDSYESLKVTARRMRDLLWSDGWKPEEVDQIEELRKRADESVASIENGEADYAEAKARYEAARALGQDHW